MIVPRAYTRQSDFDAAVRDVERQLHPSVLRLRYTFENDWTGEPSVFFKVTLSDAVATPGRLWDVTNYVATMIEQHIEPLEAWGVRPYFNYRSQSEQAQLNEPAWA